jgi:hypothetical protein
MPPTHAWRITSASAGGRRRRRKGGPGGELQEADVSNPIRSEFEEKRNGEGGGDRTHDPRLKNAGRQCLE